MPNYHTDTKKEVKTRRLYIHIYLLYGHVGFVTVNGQLLWSHISLSV